LRCDADGDQRQAGEDGNDDHFHVPGMRWRASPCGPRDFHCASPDPGTALCLKPRLAPMIPVTPAMLRDG
jgi:hypothetical protein